MCMNKKPRQVEEERHIRSNIEATYDVVFTNDSEGLKRPPGFLMNFEYPVDFFIVRITVKQNM